MQPSVDLYFECPGPELRGPEEVLCKILSQKKPGHVWMAGSVGACQRHPASSTGLVNAGCVYTKARRSAATQATPPGLYFQGSVLPEGSELVFLAFN